MGKFWLSKQRFTSENHAFDNTGGTRSYEKPASGLVAITKFAVGSEDEEDLGPWSGCGSHIGFYCWIVRGIRGE